MICHTPIQDALKVPFPLAVQLQRRFAEQLKEIMDSVKNGHSDKIAKLMSFPLPEEWQQLKDEMEHESG